MDPDRPYAFCVEPERGADGRVDDVATIFLTNRECPFRCLMCDLWKNTLDGPTPRGAIPRQIDYALSRLPPARRIKLYNSGNFFDPRAVPLPDHDAISDRVSGFQTVIVENHPRFCGDDCLRFRDRINGNLEVAIGLETAHPEVLAGLNKQMTLDDFERAVCFLRRERIAVRAFILVKPPLMSEDEAVEWAVRSLEFAFALDVGCCSLIPTRSGNGIMDRLEREGLFAPPRMSSLEASLEAGIGLANRGTFGCPTPPGWGTDRTSPTTHCRRRVFIDLWDIERFYDCPRCGPPRAERLRRMNLSQRYEPPIACSCETA
jgi:radical SAM enzyme (TIGR01210 family)